MKKTIFSYLLLLAIFFIGCKKDSDSSGGGTTTPAPGSTRSITADLTYHTGQLASTSWAAWPMVNFPVDNNAKSYKVRLYGFKTTLSGLEGKIYTWQAGQLPPTSYNIFPDTKGIKDGNYYMSVDRTWCSGAPSACNESAALEFVATYKLNWGSPKAEVTYQY